MLTGTTRELIGSSGTLTQKSTWVIMIMYFLQNIIKEYKILSQFSETIAKSNDFLMK